MMKKPILGVAVLSLFLAALSVATGPSWAQTEKTPESAKGIAAVVLPFVDSHALAGAVTLVASKDKVLDLEAVGYADLAAKKPMKTDDLFWIASQTKPMTATAMMMLVDEGKVNLDDPVEKYLPEFKGQMLEVKQEKGPAVLKKPVHPITIREILSHTSGLPNIPPKGGRWDKLSLKDSVLGYASTPLALEPGTKHVYCNAGINTAGRIIEVVSGMPYEEFMVSRLFKPLGMKDTTFWPTEEQVQRLAKSYKPNKEKTGLEETPITQLTYPLTSRERHGFPAGSLFSTATDLSTFCRMILNGGVYGGKRYVSEAAVQEMTSTQTGDLLNLEARRAADGGLARLNKNENGYGLCWATSRKVHDKAGPGSGGGFGHGGAYATDMQIDPQRGLIMILMVQRAGLPGPEAGKIRSEFRKAAMEAFSKQKP